MSVFDHTLSRPRRRTSREPVVPMINVVFLLLIFFLMTAQITPAPPFDLTLPEGSGEAAGDADILYVSSSGELGFGALRGDLAIEAAARQSGLKIHADGGLDGARLAAMLAQLGALGATDVQIVVDGN